MQLQSSQTCPLHLETAKQGQGKSNSGSFLCPFHLGQAEGQTNARTSLGFCFWAGGGWGGRFVCLYFIFDRQQGGCEQ